jgi:hypothetical protein
MLATVPSRRAAPASRRQFARSLPHCCGSETANIPVGTHGTDELHQCTGTFGKLEAVE